MNYDYDVIEGVDGGHLAQQVKRRLQDGWELVGGVSNRAIDGRLFQAMKKLRQVPSEERPLKEPSGKRRS